MEKYYCQMKQIECCTIVGESPVIESKSDSLSSGERNGISLNSNILEGCGTMKKNAICQMKQVEYYTIEGESPVIENMYISELYPKQGGTRGTPFEFARTTS